MSYPWPARGKNVPRRAPRPLIFESLENRFLLSAEVGLPPPDPNELAELALRELSDVPSNRTAVEVHAALDAAVQAQQDTTADATAGSMTEAVPLSWVVGESPDPLAALHDAGTWQEWLTSNAQWMAANAGLKPPIVGAAASEPSPSISESNAAAGPPDDDVSGATRKVSLAEDRIDATLLAAGAARPELAPTLQHAGATPEPVPQPASNVDSEPTGRELSPALRSAEAYEIHERAMARAAALNTESISALPAARDITLSAKLDVSLDVAPETQSFDALDVGYTPYELSVMSVYAEMFATGAAVASVRQTQLIRDVALARNERALARLQQSEPGSKALADGPNQEDGKHGPVMAFATVIADPAGEALFGTSDADELRSGIGNDTLTGFAGDDRYVFEADFGSDEVIEADAEGLDTLDLSRLTADLSIDASSGLFIVDAADNQLTASGIERIVVGQGNDELTGGAADLIYQFGALNSEDWGSDVLTAGAGDETLDFSAVTRDLTFTIDVGSLTVTDGINLLAVTGEIEHLIGGRGDDTFIFADQATLAGTIRGGPGANTLDYQDYTTSIAVDLGTGTATGINMGAADSLSGIANVFGGSADDVITGDGADNLLVGGPGDDQVDGSAGIDTVSYAGAGAGVTVTLGGSAPQATGGGGDDTLTGIENVIGSPFDDELGGDAAANLLVGGAGNDTLSGGSGDDVLAGGAGDDSIDGGADVDTIDYSDADASVTVDLSDPAAQNTMGAGVDTLADVENITGSSGTGAGPYAGDTLSGNAEPNRFSVTAIPGSTTTVTGTGSGDTLTIDAAGAAITARSSTSLTFDATPDAVVNFSGLDFGLASALSAQQTASPLSAEDLQTLADGFTALAERFEDLESIGAFANAIPLADPAGASFGALLDFGRVLRKLNEDFTTAFVTPGGVSDTSAVRDFLLAWAPDLKALAQGGNADAVPGTVSWLAQSLTTTDEVVLSDQGETTEIRFLQQLASSRESAMDLSLSETLRDAAVILERGTQFDFVSGFDLDFTYGITSPAAAAEFFLDESFALTTRASLLDNLPVDFAADSLIGFMGGSIDGAISELTAAADALLGASGGRWTLSELTDEALEPFAAANALGTVDIDLPFANAPGFSVEPIDPAAAIDFVVGNFLSEALVIDLPENSDEFTLITPNELLQMLDQLGEWLAGIARSEILDLNIPFAGTTTVGDLVAFGDAFGEELLRFLVHHDGLRLTDALLDSGVPAGAEELVFDLTLETPSGEQVYDITLALTPSEGLDRDEIEAQLIDDVQAAVGTAIGNPELAGQIEVFVEQGRLAFRPRLGARDVSNISVPLIGNESLGFDGKRLTIPRSILDSGVLGHTLEFTLDVDGVSEVITVARDAANTSVEELIADINTALVGAGYADIEARFAAGSTRELEFETGPGIGRALLTGVRQPSELVPGLLSLGVETASYTSAQALADQLADILSSFVNGVTVDFDVASKEMSFTVELDKSFTFASIPLDLSVDLGELIELQSSSNLIATADVALDFTFGVDLAPAQSLVVAPPVFVPDLPEDFELSATASFDFALYQDNFVAEDRLSGAALQVGDFTIAVEGPSAGVTWAPRADGTLTDAGGELLPDQHFFLRVTPPGESPRFVDGVLLGFDTEDNTSPVELAADLEAAMTLALASRGFADIQIQITAADGAGFNIQALGVGALGYELSFVTADEFLVADIDGVGVEPDAGNTSVDDLVTDVQEAIDTALMDAGRAPIDDALLGLDDAEVLTSGGLPVVGAIEVPDNGVLERDVRFMLTIGNTPIFGEVKAASTIDNERENETQPDPIIQLAADVQRAINDALQAHGQGRPVSVAAHSPLGIAPEVGPDTGRRIVALTAGAPPIVGGSAVPMSGVLEHDVAFTLTVDGNEISGGLRAESTSDNSDRDDLAGDTAKAINEALENDEIEGVRVSVTTDADGRLVFELTEGMALTLDFSAAPFSQLEYSASTNLGLHFISSEVVAEHTGNRVSLSALPVVVQPDADNPARLIARRVEVGAVSDDPAYQELGLLSSPVPLDGILTTDAVFRIVIGSASDETEYTVTVSADDTNGVAPGTIANTSIEDLIADINAALEDAIGDTSVTARRVMLNGQVESRGNRIEFVSNPNSGISLLALPALGDDDSNAAITQLGFDPFNEQSARIQTGEFFIRDAMLMGGLRLAAEDLSGSAIIGIGPEGGMGLGVEVVDSSGAVFANVVLSLVNPDPNPPIGYESRVSLGTIWDYLGDAEKPIRDLIDAEVTGGVAIDLHVAPVIPISTPIEPAEVSLDLRIDDWLTSAPTLTDSTSPQSVAVNVSGLDLNIYDALRNLSFEDVTNALLDIVDFLRELQGDTDSNGGGGALAAILDEPLPLLNQSASDLLVIADEFAAMVDEVIAYPSDSLQALESFLEDLLGLPDELVSLSLDLTDGIALRVDLIFETGIEASYGFDLDIRDLVELTDPDSAARTLLEGVTSLVGVSSTGDLSVGANGTVRLSFGIALGHGNGSAAALGFKDGATSTAGVLTAAGDAQAAADRLVDQDIEFELRVDDEILQVTVTAGDDTQEPVLVDASTQLSELKDAPTLGAGDDLSVRLLDGRTLDIDLGDEGDDPTILELSLALNGEDEAFAAVFDAEAQRFVMTDSSTAQAERTQNGVYVTMTSVAEFAAVQFSLKVGERDPVAVAVADATADGITRKQWLARIDEAIRQAMVDAGQLNPVAAPIVDVAYNGIVNGGQLTLQGTGDGFKARLTIYGGGIFAVEDAGDSDVASKLGLAETDADGDRDIVGKVLRQDEPADTGGLVEDLQAAIDTALATTSGLPAVTVGLLPADGDGVGRLQLTTDADTELEIGSVKQLLAPFLYNGGDGTAIELGARAAGDNLEFTAQVGPFGFFVIDGMANLDAQFVINLEDTGDLDGRTYLGSDDFAVETSYDGSASAELPLYFPTESTPVNELDNNLRIDVPSLLTFLDGQGGSVAISTPDLTAFPTPTLIGMLSNPEFIIDGLDAVLLSLQDALDGEVYGIELPLIGDGLAPAGQFIADFRADVLSYLSLKLREGGLNPVTLVRETLYNIFGSEDDGDPAAVAVLGLTAGQQSVGVLESTTLDSALLERDAELNIMIGNAEPVRLVVLAEDVEADGADSLVAAVRDALEGRGLDDELSVESVAVDGGFILRFRTSDPSDRILIDTAGAIPFDLFGVEIGGLGLLQDVSGVMDLIDGLVDVHDVVKSGFGLFDEFGQFDFLLGQREVFGESLDFDLGLPILQFDLDAGVELALEWELGFGFGVSQTDGFYFVTDSTLIPDSSEELRITLDVGLLGVLGFAPGSRAVMDLDGDRVVLTGTAELPANGRLSGDVVFALDVDGELVEEILVRANATHDNTTRQHLADDIQRAIDAQLPATVSVALETDTSGEPTGRLQLIAQGADTSLAIYDSATAFGQLGFLVVEAVDGGRGRGSEDSPADPRERRYSGLGLTLAIDIRDPNGDNDRLTFSELSASSTSLGDIMVASAEGDALVNLGLIVSFDALGIDAAVLPGIGTDLFIEWNVAFDTLTGVEIGTPMVEFQDITLDLGSFITDFAGPYLEGIGDVIEPLGFLIDKNDGLLYQRLPVISDLAGETVTIKRLAELLDSEARIVPFLNALEQVYFLVDLVSDAAAEAANSDSGAIEIEFGTIMLGDLGSVDSLQDATPVKADNFNDDPTSDFNRGSDSNRATRSFTKNVTKPGPGSIDFAILRPETIIDLLLGRPDTTLITYDLPPFGFDFEYRQRFPIYPPLFATLGGFFSATIDLGFGYDTLGLNQFLGSDNPLDLINGFFVNDVDADGVDIPEVTLYGAITAGASLDVAVASAGVEGGIDATIWLNLNDPNLDTKVRLGEIAGNILLNSFNPLAAFDTSGQFDAFLRAYIEVLFGVWSAELELARVKLASFDIPFNRAPVLGQDLGNGVLQVNMGPASVNRLHGPLADGDQTINVWYDAGSVYLDDDLTDLAAAQRFVGVERIVIDAGAGNDTIDLSGMDNSGIVVEVRGGSGNDTIIGAPGSRNMLYGGEGNDTIQGGSRDDTIDGGDGRDTIWAGGGADIIVAGAGDDDIHGDAGDDDIDAGTGDDRIDGGAGDDIYRFSGLWGDDVVAEVTAAEAGSVAGGTDTWDFAATTTDVAVTLGSDVRIGSVENVQRVGELLRITSTRHGLRTGDQIELSGILAGTQAGEVLLQGNATVAVEPGELDSFLVFLPTMAGDFEHVDGTGIFQLDRAGLTVEELRSADALSANPLAQIETGLRHGLEDGDQVRLGGRDPLTGAVSLLDEEFTVTVVDAWTINLDGSDAADPRFSLDELFVQREETGAGLIREAVAANGAVTITSPRHGLSDGDEIAIFGSGHDALNGKFLVAVEPMQTDRFTLVPSALDGSGLGSLPDGLVAVSMGVWQLNQTRAESIGNTVTHNGYGIETLKGGRGGDTFEVFQTGAREIVLNGLGGSDTYIGYATNARVQDGVTSDVKLFDDGNFWDTDISIYFGSQGDDLLGVDRTIIVSGELADIGAGEVSGFEYGEPNVVLGFQSGQTGLGGIEAQGTLDSVVLDRPARFLLALDDEPGVLVIVEPEDLGGDTAGDLVAAVNAALAETELAGIVVARSLPAAPAADEAFSVVFDVLDGGMPPAVDATRQISIENVSQGSGIEALDILARGGNDVIAVGSTNSRTAVNVSSGLGDDWIAVGGPANAAGDPITLDGIRGSVLTGPLVVGGDEGSNTLVVSDQGELDDNVGRLDERSISGLDMQIDIEYADIQSLIVQLGFGHDTFTIARTTEDTTQLFAGAGEDGIDIERVDGNLRVSGQLGDDNLTLQSSRPASQTGLFGDAGADQINVRALAGRAVVDGGSGDDNIDVGSTAGTLAAAATGNVAAVTSAAKPGPLGQALLAAASFAEPGTLNAINGSLSISGGTGADTLNIDDTADGGSTLVARSAVSERVASFGRLGADATFTLDFGENERVDIVVTADVGILTAAETTTATNGRLSQDAFFVLNIGEDQQVGVLVEADDTNSSPEDLLADINAALELVDIAADRIHAELDASTGTYVLVSLQGESVGIEIESGNAAAIELGFADGTEGVFDNNELADLETDINSALQSAGVDDRVAASIDSGRQRLRFELLSGQSLLVLLDENGAAATDLGLADGQLLQTDNVGTLTIDPATGRAQLTGLGMGRVGDGLPGITYDTIANVNIALGSGNDQFNVQGTLNDETPAFASVTTLATGGGDDEILVSDSAPSRDAERGHLDGTLDAVQGELRILAGDGANSLDISDRASLVPDDGVVITAARIDGLAPAPILYGTTGRFSSGINIWAGQGSDSMEVRSVLADHVTTLYANAGDDVITVVDADATAADGLLAVHGELGDDFIDATAWLAALVAFGDLGDLEFDMTDRRPETLSRVTVFDALSGGDDVLYGGHAGDALLGGIGNDTIAGNDGNDLILGDNGTIDFASGRATVIQTSLPSDGGDDRLAGNDGNDVLLGGAGRDELSGQDGDDALTGDGGKVTYGENGRVQVEATDLFIGAPDRLAGGIMSAASREGGDGNDIIIGGAGYDLLFGTLAEDILIFEYGRVTLVDGRAESVVVLGQRPLDLAASEMFDLYLKEPPLVPPHFVGDLAADRLPIADHDIRVSTGPTERVPTHHAQVSRTIELPEVRFEFNSTVLTAQARASLLETAAALAEYAGAMIAIAGHSDAAGDADYNQTLSEQRAAAVRDFLIEQGVDPTTLEACGYGESRPAYDNDAMNRRVELEFRGIGQACAAPTEDDAANLPDAEDLETLSIIALAGWHSMGGSLRSRRRARMIDWSAL